jgi:hypothetical protein
LGSGLKIVLAALLVCAFGAAATTSAAKPKPKPKPKTVTLYRVSVTSTYVHHHVVTLVSPKSPNNGCSERYDVDATQTVTAATTTPVVRTLAQLNRGDFPALKAHEVRNGTGRDGWEPGCPALKDDPAELEDTSACGTQDYSIANPSVGFLTPTSTRFALTYKDHAADPYEGNCFAGVFLDPDSDDLVLALDFPPTPPFGTATGTKPFWADLARSRLKVIKPIVLHWTDTATVTEPFIDDDPSFLVNTSTASYTLSWEIKLVPFKRVVK